MKDTNVIIINAKHLADNLQNTASVTNYSFGGMLWDSAAMLRTLCDKLQDMQDLHIENTALRCTEMALRDEIESLRRQLAAMVPDGVFAWATFDGEGGYDLRLYDGNESYQDDYIKRNGEKYADWVIPLSAAPAQPEQSKTNQCGETCERAKLCAICASGIAPEQSAAHGEPVAWSPRLDYPQYAKQRVWANGKPRQEDIDYWSTHGNGIDYAYANPQQASKPMTDEQAYDLFGVHYQMPTIRAVERFHKIGENHAE